MKITGHGQAEPSGVAKDLRHIVVVCFAALLMAVNIRTFVRTGGLFPGGATGLTILIQGVFERFLHISVPYTVVNLTLNAIPIYIGFRFIGRKFTAYSCLMIVLTSVLTDLIPGYVITYDTLLVSIFGGLINGLVISLCLRENATTGGTDFLAIYFSEKLGHDCFNMIFILNAVILTAAGLLNGWDKALYSIIFQYTSTQAVHVLYRTFQQETMFIVTDKPQEVSERIHELSHHGATIIRGEGAYQGSERMIVYSVISRADHIRVMKAIREIDQGVFVNVLRTDQLQGRFYYKPYE